MTTEVTITSPKVSGFNRSPTTDSPTFQLCIAYLLENPLLGDKDLARLTGRTRQLCRALMKSDVFQAKLAEAVFRKYGESKGRLRTELVELARKGIKSASEMVDAQKLTPQELISLLKEIIPQINSAVMTSNGAQPQAAVNVNLNGSFVPSSILMEARERATLNARAVEVISDNLKPLEVLDNVHVPTPRSISAEGRSRSIASIKDLEITDAELLDVEACLPRGAESGPPVRGCSTSEAREDVPGSTLSSGDNGRDN